MEHESLKALSIQQPWAERILRGEKTVEFRSQITKIRRRFYIYASATKPDLTDSEIRQEVGCSLSDLPKGVLVGTVEIVDCIGGDGEYEWILANPARLDEPLKPTAQPKPVWFYLFGASSDFVGDESSDDETIQPLDDDTRPSTTRLTPVIAASTTPPFTPYHSKYFAFELTKQSDSDSAGKMEPRTRAEEPGDRDSRRQESQAVGCGLARQGCGTETDQ